MMKRNSILLFLLAVIVLFACKRTNRDIIIGKWRAVKVENPSMDSFFAHSKIMIDTIGVGHDSATNMELYGVANMDSMRDVMRMQYDSAKAAQYGAVNNATYWFRKDSIAIITFGDNTDSSKWYFNEKGNLVLEEMVQYGPDKISMDVVSLSDTMLKLRFSEDEDTSIVTFRMESRNP